MNRTCQHACSSIEALNKITHVRLDRENIGEIDSLELLGPKVTNVYLQQNCIQSIQNLECLPNLQFLMLAGNRISRVENLQHLNRLLFLDLSDNAIGDFDIGMPAACHYQLVRCGDSVQDLKCSPLSVAQLAALPIATHCFSHGYMYYQSEKLGQSIIVLPCIVASRELCSFIGCKSPTVSELLLIVCGLLSCGRESLIEVSVSSTN